MFGFKQLTGTFFGFVYVAIKHLSAIPSTWDLLHEILTSDAAAWG